MRVELRCKTCNHLGNQAPNGCHLPHLQQLIKQIVATVEKVGTIALATGSIIYGLDTTQLLHTISHGAEAGAAAAFTASASYTYRAFSYPQEIESAATTLFLAGSLQVLPIGIRSVLECLEEELPSETWSYTIAGAVSCVVLPRLFPRFPNT